MDAIQGLPPYVFVMLGLYAGLRREEILALQWDSVYLDTDTPYLTVRRAWHTESNRPVILDELKTKAAARNIPLPICLADCLREAKVNSTSEYVVPNRDGDPLSYTQFKRLWQYIVTRTTKEPLRISKNLLLSANSATVPTQMSRGVPLGARWKWENCRQTVGNPIRN